MARSEFIRKMLGRQQKRVTAIVMGHAERSFYDKLTPDQRAEFRATVLAAISSYHQACLDMIEASVSDGAEINEEAVRVIAQFNENVQTYRDELQGLVAGG